MKSIKLILLSAIVAAMLTSCGMNNSSSKATPTPRATQNNGNVSNTNNGTVSDDTKKSGDTAGNAVKDTGDAAGNAIKDTGDAAGDVVEDVGDAAGDVVEGVGDAVSGNDSNNNNR